MTTEPKAWARIDLTDFLDLYDPCSDCPCQTSEPGICPHLQAPDDEPCAWEEVERQVRAFLEKANLELEKILRGNSNVLN